MLDLQSRNICNQISHDEGRATPDTNGYRYEYFYTDYLGNVRLSFRDSIGVQNVPVITQINAYDAWGQMLQGIDYERNTNNKSNNFKYNGKENQDDFGIGYTDYGVRMYDKILGRWFVIDPLAEKLPFSSPYVYTLNNPLKYIDPDGAFPYPITVRSFHPLSGFGGTSLGPGFGRNFSGDDRGFSNNPSAIARVHHTVIADPDKGTLSYSSRNTFSSASHHPYFGEGTETPTGYANKTKAGNGSIAFETGYSGSNPLALGPTPDIDIKSFFNLTQTNDILNVNANIYGDDFPNTELFIKDPSGQSLFLGADVREGGNDNNPLILVGGANTNIMNINVSVKIDDKGNFTGVVQGNRTWSISDWNERFRNKDANPNN